jgi:predicted PurR-regulated permease PerM
MKRIDLQLSESSYTILKVFGVILALGFLWLIRDIVIIVLLALVFASAMEPMVDYLAAKKVPRSVSVLGVYLIVVGVLIGLAVLIWPQIFQQFQVFTANLPNYVQSLTAQFPSLKVWLGPLDVSKLSQSFFASGAGNEFLLGRASTVFGGLFGAITVLVISFYLVTTDRGMKRAVRDLVPEPHQDFVAHLIAQIQRKMGYWVLGQLVLGVAIFTMTYIALSLLGVEYALFLAILAGLFELMPYIGPFLAAVPAVLVASLQSPGLALVVVVLYIVIQKTEGYILVPKVMQRAIGASPLVVLLSLLIGFRLAGLPGLLLAVPLAGAIIVVIQEFSGRPQPLLEPVAE